MWAACTATEYEAPEHLRFDEVTCSVVVASVTLLQPALGTSVPDNQQGLISTSVESVSRLYRHATVRRSPLSLRFWLPRSGHCASSEGWRVLWETVSPG
jgi:hypothetical protein